MQSTNTSNFFAAYPYYFPSFDNGRIGQSTEASQPPSDTFLVDVPDLSRFPPAAQGTHLEGGFVPSPFLSVYLAETFGIPYFDESEGGLAPPTDLLHGPVPFHNQPAPFPTASVSETTGSAISPITPARRVQNGERRNEAKRFNELQNDEYIASFTEARVICAGCHKSIKLDTRDGARYYPGFWVKHRGRCKIIRK